MATTSALTESQKRQKILDSIKKSHPNLSGEQLHNLDKLMEVTHIAADVAEAVVLPIAEAIVEHIQFKAIVTTGVARAAAASEFLAILGPLLSIVGAIALAYGMVSELLRALKTSLRLYGMRAIAYTITAWAFDQPIPIRSEAHLKEIRRNPYTGGYSVADHEQEWRRVSNLLVANLERQMASKKSGKKNAKIGFQMILRAIGNNDPEDLCDFFLVAFESELTMEVERMWWREMYKKAYYPK